MARGHDLRFTRWRVIVSLEQPRAANINEADSNDEASARSSPETAFSVKGNGL